MPYIIPFAVIHVGVSLALAAILLLVYRRLHRADFLLYWAFFWVLIAANLTASQIASPFAAGAGAPGVVRVLNVFVVFLMPTYPALMIFGALAIGGGLSRKAARRWIPVIGVVGVALAATVWINGSSPMLGRWRAILTGLSVFVFAFRLATKGHRDAGRARVGLVVLTLLYGIHNILLGRGFYGPAPYTPFAATVGILFQFSLTLALAWDAVDRASDATREAQEFGRRFQSLLQSVGMAGLIVDCEGQVEFCNEWLQKALGPAEVTGVDWLESFVPAKDREQVREVYQTGLKTGHWPAICEYPIAAEGKELTLQWYHTPLQDRSGRIVGAASLGVDLSQQRLLENQAGQAQRLETLGRMAGGVAHDFNNHLTVINGYADLLLRDAGEENPFHEGLKAIRASGELAATLTSQLLTFSRRRKVAPLPVSLNDTVMKTMRIVSRLIREDVSLEIDLASQADLTAADPGQLDHVVMNLVLNASDAVSGPGRIRVATRAFRDDRGEFAVLDVEDNGGGMDEWTRSRIFEPFFTTKAEGKGTGLGLASVHGTVTQAGGWIEVKSEPGKGSLFSAYLPKAEWRTPAIAATVSIPAASEGPSTILLVEDQHEVREFAALALAAHGYRVLQAASGAEALQIAKPVLDIRLLVSDVIMPGMPGIELARLLRESRPGLPVLFVSGHTFEHQIGEQSSGAGPSAFLPKPFTGDQLSARVSGMIDQTAGRKSASQ